MYYKGLPKQLMTYKFDTVRSVLVSACCLVAAALCRGRSSSFFFIIKWSILSRGERQGMCCNQLVIVASQGVGLE